MHSDWLRIPLLRVLKFLQITEGGPNFWGEPILRKVWIIWSPFRFFNFKSFMDPNFLSFIRFQCIFYHSVVLCWESWNFYKLTREDLISRGELITYYRCLIFFLPEYVVPATELAQQNGPDPCFTEQQWKNRCRKFFVSYLQVNLCHGLVSLGHRRLGLLLSTTTGGMTDATYLRSRVGRSHPCQLSWRNLGSGVYS